MKKAILGIIIVAASISTYLFLKPVMPLSTEDIYEWPQHRPRIQIRIINSTPHVINMKRNNITTELISLQQINLNAFDLNGPAPETTRNGWEATDKIIFYTAHGRITLSIDAIARNNVMELAYILYRALRQRARGSRFEIEPNAQYRLTVTLQGDTFENSVVHFEKSEE